MSILVATSRPGASDLAPRVARWVGFVALLLAEGLALALRFEIPHLDPAAVPWWLWPLTQTQARVVLVPGLLGLGTAAVLAEAWRGAGRTAGWLPLLAHGAALASFVALSAVLFEGDSLVGPRVAGWVFAWYGAAALVVLTWKVALHPDGWRSVLGPSGLGALAVGGLVGAGSFLLRCGTSQLWPPLARGTLVLVRLALGSVATTVDGDPALYQIGIDGFVVRIAPTCSGFEGIGLVGAFLAVYLTLARRSLRWPNAWALVPLGIAAIWLTNAVRIALLILIGAWWSPEVALEGFHSQAGSLAFLVISLGLLTLSRRCRTFAAGPVAGPDRPSAVDPIAMATINPTAAHLAPFLAVVAVTMITGAFSAGFDALYPLRILAGACALARYRRVVSGRLFEVSWFAAAAGLVVLAAWLALEPSRGAGATVQGAGYARLGPIAAGLWLVFRVVGSVVVVPLAEEWAFRGYLARRLIAADFESVPPGRFTWFSFVASSVLFGLLHGRWLAGTLAGLIYAGVYHRRGRVGEAAFAHAVTNAGIAALALVSGDWGYWS